MAAKFSMVNTSGLFDTAAHVEASDRMQDAMEELKVKNDRQQRAAERQRAAAAQTAKEQSQRLARARDHARANAAKSDDAYVRARKPNENQDEEEDDNDSDSDFSDDGYGLPDAFRLGASIGKAGEDDEDDEDDALLDELDADPELERLRARRLAQLKTQFEQKQALLAKGHGELREIDQDAFLKEVTGSARVLVHFYHRDFERCKIMDMHLARLAKTHIECKFLKLNAEKAPFFVEKLAVRVLPTVIGFADGVAYPQRVIGFDGLTDEEDEEDRADGGGAFGSRLNYRAKSSDTFPTIALARKLEDIGVITHNEADEDETNNA